MHATHVRTEILEYCSIPNVWSLDTPQPRHSPEALLRAVERSRRRYGSETVLLKSLFWLLSKAVFKAPAIWATSTAKQKSWCQGHPFDERSADTVAFDNVLNEEVGSKEI